jgi:hypothetical protein
MKYREGYKYQLYEDESFITGIYGKHIKTDFIELFPNGVLMGRKGYAWDGPSGPTFDTKNSLRPSLGHDMGFQLIREGLLDPEYKDVFDGLFYIWLRADGMNHLRAYVWFKAVSWFAGEACKPENDRKILEAP